MCHVLGHFDGDSQAEVVGLSYQDRAARLEGRWRKLGHEAELETGSEAFSELRQKRGERIGGQDDLLLFVVERVEGVKKLLLGPLFSGQKLDVIDQKCGGGGSANTQSVLPRHRGAVERYFERK